MKNMKYLTIGLIGVFLIMGSAAALNIGFNNSNSFDATSHELLIHNLYPYYTYDELMEYSDIVVSGQISSISESKWSTLDGKQPEGIVIKERIDENGEPCTDYIINLKEDEFIYTDVVLKVNSIYKGEIKEDEIIVRLLSGTVNGMRISENPGLDIKGYDEKGNYLFFLSKHKTYDGEEISNCYSINTPRGALIKQTNAFRLDLRNQNEKSIDESFINFDGEKLDLKLFNKEI